VSVFADRRLLARAAAALVLANLRFWTTVAPEVSAQLRRWERRAHAINDPASRALALQKLADERFNSEVAATLATLAPRAYRRRTIEAIVAYEVMYDYLDGLTELPSADPLQRGRDLYEPFVQAVRPPMSSAGSAWQEQDGDDYVLALAATVREALAALPAAAAIREAGTRAATRCAEAQTRAHAVPQLGVAQLQDWAASETAASSLGWREFLAGSASSVLVVHALIAAAADPRTTVREAAEIDTVYLSICALSTMLDSLIDHEQDTQAGQEGYAGYYESNEHLASDLAHAARRATAHSASLRNGAHHVMTLVGVAAYYASAPSASNEFAAPVTQRISRELQPLMTPTLAVMRTWRLAKQARRAIRHTRGD
jgi:tetraprenyl-beta-curcumene synthase